MEIRSALNPKTQKLSTNFSTYFNLEEYLLFSDPKREQFDISKAICY